MRGIWTALLPAVLVVAAAAQEERSTSNRLGYPEGMVDQLVMLDRAEDWAAGELQRVEIEEASPPRLVLVDERENRFPRRGRWTSAEIQAAFPFTELIPSWNAEIPEGTGVTFDIRARDERSGEWSPWLYVGQWGRTPRYPRRTLRFDGGRVNTDHLVLEQPADAFQIRAALFDYNLEPRSRPSVRRIAVSHSGVVQDATERERLAPAAEIAGEWARDLDVPFRAQRDNGPAIGGSTCSPTSVSMVMAHWGVDRPTLENALAIYDQEYGMFGNWSRATQRAAELGLDAWVTRFRRWDQVRAQIAAGQPVIASMRFREGEFPSHVLKSTGGHLIVIRGFTSNGDVIVNDPASVDRGERVVYDAEELAHAWFDKGGVAYIIRSPDHQGQ